MSDETHAPWATEEMLRTICDAALDAVVVINGAGEFVHWNPAAEGMFGFSAEEIMGRRVHELLVPDRYRERAARGVEQFATSGRGPAVGKVLELEALRKDGTEFPIEIVVSPVRMEDQWWASAIIRDISKRKQAEEALRKERQSLRQMLEMQDRDRKLIAYEIHDGLAQQLAGANIHLQVFEQLKDRDAERAAKSFQQGIELLNEGIAEVRRLIGGLRPLILDDSGVAAAVQHLAHDCRAEGGPQVEFVNCAAFDRLEPTLENAIFRIVQESLTNARRHSQSDKVRIELAEQNDRIRIEVRDWGTGFDPENIREKSFGLGGIRERARLLGGRADVHSAPGKGTRIVVELPIVGGYGGDGPTQTPDETDSHSSHTQ